MNEKFVHKIYRFQNEKRTNESREENEVVNSIQESSNKFGLKIQLERENLVCHLINNLHYKYIYYNLDN